MKVLLIVLTSFYLAGCGNGISGGTMRYDGPGNFQDLAKARYECYNSTKDYSSSASAGSRYAYASSNTLPSCGAFNACIASKGFIKSKVGRLDASSITISCKR